jgi:hypothetical protein
MKFNQWIKDRIILEAGKKRAPKPVSLPKPESKIVKPKRNPKQRIPKGRLDTTFVKRPETRGSERRRSLEDQ